MSERRALYVFGASGHGKVVAEAALAGKRYLLRGFLDDDETRQGQTIFGLPVQGGLGVLEEVRGTAGVALGVGSNRERLALLERLVDGGHAVEGVVHPSAVVASSAQLGDGIYIGPQAVLHADARVGRGCIVNSGAVVEHDNLLGDGVHVSPNAALGGGVALGTGVHIGLCAAVLPNLTVGDWAVVGAGAVVTADVTAHLTVAGVPARPVHRSASSGADPK